MLNHVGDIQARHRILRKKFIIPTIGVLVALTAAGGLLLTSTNRASTTPKHRVNIGSALTLERGSDGTVHVVSDMP